LPKRNATSSGGRATGIKVALVEPGEVKTAIWEKGDATVDELERTLDDDGRERYGWLINQSRGFIDEGRHRGVDPDRVAQGVEHALTARRPKARYLVGPDAKAYGHVLTRLPDRLRDTLTDLGSRRWERRGRKIHVDSAASEHLRERRVRDA
jgi:hypothetical protein